MFEQDWRERYWDDYFYDDYYSPKKSQYDKKEDSKTSYKSPSAPIADDSIPLCLTESFDSELTETLAIQLLTGSVIVNKSSVNPTEWIANMDSIYEKRFNYKKDKKSLEEWICNMVDFLVFTKDSNLLRRLKLTYGEEFTTSDTSDICALSMLNYIEAARPSECDSEVLELMLIELERYIPDGVQDYF